MVASRGRIIEFHGAKLALFYQGSLVVYRRDNTTGIPFPGYLDFPGGGREGNESPEACVLRELNEEFAIQLPQSRLAYSRAYQVPERTAPSFFFTAEAHETDIQSISFGDEGRYWGLISPHDYMAHHEGIPNLQSRLADYLAH